MSSRPAPAIDFRRRFSQDLPKDSTVTIPWTRGGVGLTSSGYLFVASILYLVFSSSRHALNAGYLVLFCLGILLVLSSWSGLLVIAGLRLTVKAGGPVAAGSKPYIELEIESKTKRNGVEIWTEKEPCFVALDLAKDCPVRVRLELSPRDRGVHQGPKFVIQTRQPLGLWRIYVRWEPLLELMVHPAPEGGAPELRSHGPEIGDQDNSKHNKKSSDTEFGGGLKPYQAGESQRAISWRTYAKSDGHVLASKEGLQETQDAHRKFSLEEAMSAGDLESALSRLTAWVLRAHALGQTYTLSLGSAVIGPDTIAQPSSAGFESLQLDACLKALACHPRTGS